MRTIKEWSEITGVIILDPDGFDRSDPRLSERLFTFQEFEKGMMESTISAPSMGSGRPVGVLPEDRVLSKREYNTIHKYIGRKYQKTGSCEFCCEPARTQWSSKTKRYDKHDRNEWQELCVPCHQQYDAEKFGKLTPSQLGKKYGKIKNPNKGFGSNKKRAAEAGKKGAAAKWGEAT